ncbi:TIGR01777 family oxidoreductase [Desulfotalea psychrophila]|uniref:Uncharacterized protein n=1 Tax=Desulfotalea psychrophila (strain LSv54 / DSM 12343) TaxID=177439 RepID=Q6ANU0_DESPS|nr:TIGR01777 family oxidoreductase [Desulfotalea psychrophila]CAG35984.1 conserved hypothetical protein [Desulfotalea psychrophila LSv54]
MTDKRNKLQKKSIYPVDAQYIYAWHARPGALERLIPPWQEAQVLERSGGLGRGGKTTIRMRIASIAFTVKAEHLQAIPGKMFEDRQTEGPFSLWQHRHLFQNEENGASMEDLVQYRLPVHEFLPSFVHGAVKKELTRTFTYRHEILRHDLARHQRYSWPPLRILISGASGTLGRELVPFLESGGHRVFRLVRRGVEGDKEIYWNPALGEIDSNAIPEIDAIIHLAGEQIGLSRWSRGKKERVLRSRKNGTRLLCAAMAKLPRPPQVFLSASATGYYGDSPEQNLSEEQEAGSDFISQVCKVWEKEAAQAEITGIRTAMLRMGVTLSHRGGALKRLLQIGKIALPRSFGNGRQYTSWIDINDMLAAILHCLVCPEIRGPINIVSPQPVRNEELLATIAQIKKRPLLPRVPASFLTFLYGEMAREIALANCHVSSKKLVESGFCFQYPELKKSLKIQLGRYR